MGLPWMRKNIQHLNLETGAITFRGNARKTKIVLDYTISDPGPIISGTRDKTSMCEGTRITSSVSACLTTCHPQQDCGTGIEDPTPCQIINDVVKHQCSTQTSASSDILRANEERTHLKADLPNDAPSAVTLSIATKIHPLGRSSGVTLSPSASLTATVPLSKSIDRQRESLGKSHVSNQMTHMKLCSMRTVNKLMRSDKAIIFLATNLAETPKNFGRNDPLNDGIINSMNKISSENTPNSSENHRAFRQNFEKSTHRIPSENMHKSSENDNCKARIFLRFS
jgi:hypothetical protein